jgi:nitroreductase
MHGTGQPFVFVLYKKWRYEKMDSIFHRISVRKFEAREVELEKIEKILAAGMQAPSAMNQQPWEFYVVTNPEILQKLGQSGPYSGPASKAPAAIVSVYRKSGLPVPAYAPIDMSIAMENIWLETDSLGLGGVWIGTYPMQERMDAVRKVLNIPDSLEVFALFPFGYPAEKRPQQDRTDIRRIHYVR